MTFPSYRELLRGIEGEIPAAKLMASAIRLLSEKPNYRDATYPEIYEAIRNEAIRFEAETARSLSE